MSQKNKADCAGLAMASLVLLSVLILCSCRQQQPVAEPKRKAVFIILDGIAADIIEDLALPALDSISKEGGFTRAYVGGVPGTYTETPTISAVGYNSLLTGTWVNKHNVWGNEIKDPNYHYWNLFRIVESYNAELKTAIFSTWTDNRTRLVGEGLRETGDLQLDYSFDGLEHDTVRYPHDDSARYIHRIDEAVSREAARYIREEGPDLSWVYLQYTDDIGHRFGDSERFHDAVRIADNQVGRIRNAIAMREDQFDEDWLIVVTTDHGRDSVSGKHHGGQTHRERLTWIVTNSDDLNERFGQTPGVVDIMPSILNHLDIPIPEELSKETDGVPFIGNADIANLKAVKRNGEIVLTWKSLQSGDGKKATILVAETNHFKEGGKDVYRNVAEVNINEEALVLDLDATIPFHKVLLKGPHHYINTWVVPEQ